MEKVAKQLTCENSHLVFARNSDNVEKTECKITGVIPTWLNGHLMRNGPGEFDVGKDTFKHWFDGHALIHKYDISDGNVSYMSKFVMSEDYKINHEKEKIIIAGFGTSSIPDPCKNIFSRFFTKFFSRPPVSQNACVNVTSLGSTSYAITDAPWCEKFNSESLEAEEYINLTDLFGMIMSTAHPHFDMNGDFYNLATNAGRNGYYAIYRVPVGSLNKSNPMKDMQIHSKVTIDSPLKPCYYHSFGLSENYIIIHEHPVRIDAFKIMKSTFTWDPIMSVFDHQAGRESVFHVVDKNKQKPHPIKYCSKGRFTFHHINSYERTVNEKKFLIVDLLCADGPTFFYFWMEILRSKQPIEKLREPPTMWPYRFVLPLVLDGQTPKGENLVEIPGCQARAILRKDGSVFLTPELLMDKEVIEKFHLYGVEFPTTNYKEYNTKSYKYMYCVGQEGYKSFDCLCKVNVETKEVLHWKEEGYFPSEPIFVKNPQGVDEDDGVILSSVINVNPNDPIFLLVLDAKTFTELGRAEVMAKLNFSFHGGFFGASKLQQSKD